VTEQPARHTVDTITSDALDQLYADRDEARAAADRYLTNGTKAVERLHWRAHNAEQRAEQAETALARVRAELDRIAALPTVDRPETRCDRFSVGANWAVGRILAILEPTEPRP
jgi:hypothetical protein